VPHAARLGDRIVVETRWNDKELIKSIPGSRWDANDRVWTLPLTWAACVQLRGVFADSLTIDQSLSDWAWQERRERVTPALEMRQLTESGIGNGNLYPFQRAGVNFLRHAGSALLGDEMGTGKTIQLLDTMSPFMAQTEMLPALVICPNSVKVNWAREAARWLSEAIPYVLTGTTSNRTKLIEVARQDSTALVVTNYESLLRLSRLAPFGSIRLSRCVECDPQTSTPDCTAARCEVHPRVLNRVPFKTIIVDEAHRIKDPKAKQTRAVWALGSSPNVVWRFALTGTPLANDPSDLWSIMHFVAPNEYPTKSKFVDRYALQAWNSHGGLDVVGLNPLTRDEFFSFFDTRFRRMPKDVVLTQLPPKVRSTRLVEMTPKQRRAYDDLAKRLITTLDDGSLLVAKDNLSAQIRLLQLSSSYCKIDIGPDPNDLSGWTVELTEPSPKVDELITVLDELGTKQCVVAADHRRLIELAASRLEKLGVSHGLIVGGMDEYARDRVLQNFQDGKTRVLLFTLKAGGVGLTMTAADTMIRLQRSWSMIDNLQGEDRVHRIGSERHKSVHIIDIVTEGTVEETQLERLNVKLQRLEEITRDRITLMRVNGNTAQLDEEIDRLRSGYLGAPA
jgi:SNF2 family DNA or RNA helicase